jgi:hemerythrin-like domain-containing protein
MPDPISLWNRDHTNFAVLLDLLERQLDLFHQGESADYDLMSDIMFYMTHYTDLAHHPREDLAFARICEREPGMHPVIDELSAQHVRLRGAGQALIQALDDIVNGSITSRDSVEAPARTYIELFRSHMEREEAILQPLVMKLLQERDWAAIDATVSHIEDPLFGSNGEERYAALRQQIAREARISSAAAIR